MELIELKNAEIPRLFLEKLEKLNDKEREVLIQTIDLINRPLFLYKNP